MGHRVELAGTVAELTRSTLAQDFKHIDPQQSRIVLCEAEGRLLSGFSLRLSGYATKALKSLGVEVHLGKSVDDVDDSGLRIGKTRIRSCDDFVVRRGPKRWKRQNGLMRERRQKRYDYCRAELQHVPGHPEIFAIGDVACFKTEGGRVLPGLAPVAKQQGKYVAGLIKAAVAHRPSSKTLSLPGSGHDGRDRTVKGGRPFGPSSVHRIFSLAELVIYPFDAVGRLPKPTYGLHKLVMGFSYLWPQSTARA